MSESKTYFDCTKSKTPNGDLVDKEWCYVDPIYNDGKPWGYCLPIMDYDRIRQSNLGALRLLIKLMSEINLQIGQNLAPAQQSLEEINHVQQLQKMLQTKMNEMMKNSKLVKENLDKLEKAKDQCTQQQKNVKDLLFTLDRKDKFKKSVSDEEERAVSTNRKTKDCEGMLNYESRKSGDGLIGHYYDNENWLGYYKVKKSKKIEFDWTNSEPIEGINPNNFSVIWEGFIFLPVTDSYIFSIECDDGAELYLNTDNIISHNTKTIIENYKYLISKNSKNHGDSSAINFLKSQSAPIDLVGGIKIRIKIKYFHSVHTSLYSGGRVFLRLLWQNSDMYENVIDDKYLFSEYAWEQIKITDFDIEESEIKRLHENDYAFKDSEQYVLQDIPYTYINSPRLKFKKRYQKEFLNFKVSSPVNIFIGIISHYPNPLPSDFENTGMFMSLLELDKSESKGTKTLIAKKSAKIIIYKKDFSRGSVQIKFDKNGVNLKGIPLIIFFDFDTFFTTPLICSGREKLISDSSGIYFDSCSASSELDGYTCRDGFSGKMTDEPGGMWASDNDGVGGWIEIKFKEYMRITKIQYKNRKNASERNSKIIVKFSNGESENFILSNNSKRTEKRVDLKYSLSVKFTIKDVFGTANNGGAFDIYGLRCWNHEGKQDEEINIDKGKVDQGSEKINNPTFIEPLFKRDSTTHAINLSCIDSLTNTLKINPVDIKKGNKLLIHCPESCSMSMTYIYGTEIYSKDSAICKAAYHAKKITSLGGLVNMLIDNGRDKTYKGTVSNSVKSEGKTFSHLSISFETYIKEDIIILKPGNKVDLKLEDPKKGFTWNPAIITNIMDTPKGKVIKLIQDGSVSTPITIAYPNPDKVAACGEKIKNRDCDGSVRKQESSPVLIRFVPSDYLSDISKEDKGFLMDNGNLYGYKNKPYGWSRDMKKKIYKRISFSKPYLETLVQFPSPTNSKSCTKSRPDDICEPVIWKVKVGKGKFYFKVFVGDPASDFIMNLKANSKSLFRNKLILKNTQEEVEELVDSIDEFIEISSDCEENCDYSETKLNAIQIYPYQMDVHDEDKANTTEKATSCGNSFIGGRCDKGPNVLHCLFDNITVSSAHFCNDSMVLVNVPSTYKCKEQVGKYKCVKQEYISSNECSLYCPKECMEARCIY